MIKREDMKELTIEDIFIIAEIVGKLDLDFSNFKGKSETEIGSAMIFKVLKSTGKLKNDFYKLLSNITGVPVTLVKGITYKEMFIVWEAVKEMNDLSLVFQQAKEMI